MEDLINKQRRVRFSNPVHEDQQHSTDTFTGGSAEKNWFGRQFSSAQMSQDYDYYLPSEYSAAVAASAFAVHSLEEAEAEKQRKVRDDFRDSKDNMKSKVIEVGPGPSRRSSNKETEASAKRSQSDIGFPRTSRNNSRNAISGRQIGFTNRWESKADAWEKAQIEKIRKRHERTKSSILDWENEKKLRAKLAMEKKKAEIEQRKASNNEHYRMKIARIERIAGGARAQAAERRRNEEIAAREKAKRIRSGDSTVGWFFCF